MATSHILVPSRLAAGRPETANANRTPAGRADGSTAVPAPRRSTSTVLLRLAVAMVVVLLLASLLGLYIHVPDMANVTVLSGPAVVAGLIAMYSMIAAFALAFTAAVRADDRLRGAPAELTHSADEPAGLGMTTEAH